MPRVAFTANLARHVACEPRDVQGHTVREALDAYFAVSPAVREYVLDEQGAVRKHVVVFVDGEQITDRVHLTDAVQEDAQVWVMQALSGG